MLFIWCYINMNGAKYNLKGFLNAYLFFNSENNLELRTEFYDNGEGLYFILSALNYTTI